MTGLPSFAEMIAGAAAAATRNRQEAQRPPWPLNPFPPGVRTGSVTDKVLAAAVSAHPSWLEHHELMTATGGSRGAIAWAVRYLQEHDLLRSIPSARHRQYRRYQAIVIRKESHDHDS